MSGLVVSLLRFLSEAVEHNIVILDVIADVKSLLPDFD